MEEEDKLGASRPTPRPTLGFVLLFVLFVVPGCVRDVSENDCRSLAAHVHDVWTADAKFPEKAGSSAEKAVAVIKSEGAKLEESVVVTCKRDYMGKPRASGEFSCLLQAKSYAEVQSCATIPLH
jgi:hypothetical protein